MARVHQGRPETRPADGQQPPYPLNSGYLTDGRTLFHVERTLLDDPHGELLVELEDCATMELIVCSARSVAELGMRPVIPARLTPV
ncbi:MAG TPA: hypothetical protein VFW38_00275 [Solirubrobacteraceae bacterium]|nr:hypothetical protein [Solirubrobacteraceae bacterium]